jgi:pimeloyl-ACP methyl ester carboxylesterase
MISAVPIRRDDGHDELGPAIDGERRRWHSRNEAFGEIVLYAADRAIGRPLVLVHDLEPTSSAYEVRPVFEYFRWRRPTFALDLPGFGLSERRDAAYTPEAYASVLLELLRHVRRRESSIDVLAVGRSAEIAARAARERPDLVRSLALVAPAGLVAGSRDAAQAALRRIARVVGIARAQRVFSMMTMRAMVRRALRRRFHGEPDAGLVAYAYATAHRPGAHHAPLALLDDGASVERDAVYRHLEQPVLVVYDNTPRARFGELGAFLRGSPNRHAVRISPTRGLPHFERRAETMAAMDHFWSSLPRAACELSVH